MSPVSKTGERKGWMTMLDHYRVAITIGTAAVLGPEGKVTKGGAVLASGLPLDRATAIVAYIKQIFGTVRLSLEPSWLTVAEEGNTLSRMTVTPPDGSWKLVTATLMKSGLIDEIEFGSGNPLLLIRQPSGEHAHVLRRTRPPKATAVVLAAAAVAIAPAAEAEAVAIA